MMVSVQEEVSKTKRAASEKKINKESTVCCWDFQECHRKVKHSRNTTNMRAHLIRHHPHITLTKDYKANLTSAHF